ncbi:hypothetical protein T492DRAFT_833697 [Pavlovales sp. CCMP2436]|nr:hypothetical protein T492DRAFT_833697 [Pavlovales sp. CCMP2436]
MSSPALLYCAPPPLADAASGPPPFQNVECESCQQWHDGNFGSGRFCSKSCGARFAVRARSGGGTDAGAPGAAVAAAPKCALRAAPTYYGGGCGGLGIQATAPCAAAAAGAACTFAAVQDGGSAGLTQRKMIARGFESHPPSPASPPDGSRAAPTSSEPGFGLGAKSRSAFRPLHLAAPNYASAPAAVPGTTSALPRLAVRAAVAAADPARGTVAEPAGGSSGRAQAPLGFHLDSEADYAAALVLVAMVRASAASSPLTVLADRYADPGAHGTKPKRQRVA